MFFIVYQAVDTDEGDNAVLTFHIEDPSGQFDIDSSTGVLIAKDDSKSLEHIFDVVVKDKPGLSSTLTVQVGF